MRLKAWAKQQLNQLLKASESNGLFKDLFDFCQSRDLRKVNRRVLEALIKAGAFDQYRSTSRKHHGKHDIASHHAEQTLRNKH